MDIIWGGCVYSKFGPFTYINWSQVWAFASTLYQKKKGQFLWLFTVSLDARATTRLIQESTATVQFSINFSSDSGGADSDNSWWVLTAETTYERTDGFRNWCFKSGTYSLSRERSNRGFKAKSYMFSIVSEAAIEKTEEERSKICR